MLCDAMCFHDQTLIEKIWHQADGKSAFIVAWLTHDLNDRLSQGAWTEEEDDWLRELVEARGKAWTSIGDEIGRMPSSCRDRCCFSGR